MSESRGTRPTGPRPWGREAEAIRQEIGSLGEDIVALVQEAREAHEQGAPGYYKVLVKLSNLETIGERIQRLVLEAKVGKQ